MCRLAVALATHLRLPPIERRRIELGALLHDVGKLTVPDRVRTKPGDERLREEGHSEEEIEAKLQKLRTALPLAPEGETLEPDGTVTDRKKHVL